jgi:hypothetical protein
MKYFRDSLDLDQAALERFKMAEWSGARQGLFITSPD